MWRCLLDPTFTVLIQCRLVTDGRTDTRRQTALYCDLSSSIIHSVYNNYELLLRCTVICSFISQSVMLSDEIWTSKQSDARTLRSSSYEPKNSFHDKTPSTSCERFAELHYTCLYHTLLYCAKLMLTGCLHKLLPGPFLLSYSIFVFSFSLFFRSTRRRRPNKVGFKCPCVRPSTKSFFDFNDIWYVGRGR